jgi:hypothetical protein
MGLKDLFLHYPEELPMHAMAIIEKLSPRIINSDRSMWQTFLLLLHSSILPGLLQVFLSYPKKMKNPWPLLLYLQASFFFFCIVIGLHFKSLLH